MIIKIPVDVLLPINAIVHFDSTGYYFTVSLLHVLCS